MAFFLKDRLDTLKQDTDDLLSQPPNTKGFSFLVRRAFVVILDELRDIREALREIRERLKKR